MTLDDRILEMQNKADEIGKYYYKGFGSLINGVLGDIELYLIDNKTGLMERSCKWLNQIENFYKAIPFEKLKNREEFYPLFVVKRLLPIFKHQMESSITNGIGAYASFVNLGVAIIQVGCL